MLFTKIKNFMLTSFLVAVFHAVLPINGSVTTNIPEGSKIIVGAFVAAGIGIIGKKAYDYYYDYLWPHHKAINYCGDVYKKIATTLENIKNSYRDDVALDSNRLLDYICSQDTSVYPCIQYNKKLENSLSVLGRAARVINNELDRIQKRKSVLLQDTDLSEKIQFLKSFNRLEKQGDNLLMQIKILREELEGLQAKVTSLQKYKEEVILWDEEEKRFQEYQRRSDNWSDPVSVHNSVKHCETAKKDQANSLINEYHWLLFSC
jgi:hypothetical protein